MPLKRAAGEIDVDLVQARLAPHFFSDSAFAHCARQKDGDGGAAPDRASYRNFPLMHLRQLGDDGEAKARAAASAHTRRVGAVEWLEDAEEVLLRDADAGILHDVFHLIACRGHYSDRYLTALRRVLDSVLEDVADNLRERGRVAPHLRIGTLTERNGDAASFCQRGEFLHHIGRKERKIDRSELHALRPHERGEREEVVDYFRYAVELLNVARERISHVEPDAVFHQRDLGVRLDDGKRRAQLVRDVANELLLRSEGVPRGRECDARDDVAEDDGRERNDAYDHRKVLALDGGEFLDDRRSDAARRAARGALAHSLCYRRGDVVVEKREGCADEDNDDERECYLQPDDVDLGAEEGVEAVPIEPAGNQFPAQFPEVSQRPAPIFCEGF